MTESRPARADFAVVRRIPTRWADNDNYGHVNNVTYYSYFDTAVTGWLFEASGSDIRELSAIGLVVSSSCEFLGPLSFPEQLDVGVRVVRVGTSSVTYELGIFLADDDVLQAHGRFVHVYVDSSTRVAAPIPQRIRDALAQLPSGTRTD